MELSLRVPMRMRCCSPQTDQTCLDPRNAGRSAGAARTSGCATGLLFILGVLFSHPAMAQQFEAADVRPSAAGTRESGGFLPEGRFEARATTLLKLIAYAYSLNTSQVVGGPDWLSSDRFDMEAQAASHDTSRADLRKMLQALLADRFGLVAHRDSKEMPVYLLSASKSGTELRESAGADAGACPLADGDPDLIHRACHAVSMDELSELLPQIAHNYVDRPVLDKTGLTGRYDFQLDWMNKPDYVAVKLVGRPTISMFDALKKVGLTLEAGIEAAPVVVIDRANRTPAADANGGVDRLLPTEFEAADVRPSKDGRRGWNALPDGEVDILGYTLRDLLKAAFEFKDDRVKGGPKWLDTERFDIIAKSPAAMSPHAVDVMLRTLLMERFKLATHLEDEPRPVFALVAGKGAARLQPSDGAARSECKLTIAERGREFVCRNTTMAQLVDRLPDVAQAYFIYPFVDLTKLKGAYDFTLTWTPKGRLPRVRPSTTGAQTPAGDVTVFESIDQQLGLKVEERKRPVPVIVIDHVEHL